jgi:hypothetical protein
LRAPSARAPATGAAANAVVADMADMMRCGGVRIG